MQAEIELGCKITELEEIVAGLRLEREKLYAALNRQIEAAAFEVRQLKYQIAYLTQERDDWKDKAVEISHALTYYSEQVNHSGLRLVRDPEADGPVPEMFTQNERRKK